MITVDSLQHVSNDSFRHVPTIDWVKELLELLVATKNILKSWTSCEFTCNLHLQIRHICTTGSRYLTVGPGWLAPSENVRTMSQQLVTPRPWPRLVSPVIKPRSGDGHQLDQMSQISCRLYTDHRGKKWTLTIRL